MTITYPNHQPTLDLSLARNAVLDLRPPLALRVLAGKLWITQTGDPTDHVLTTGESFQAEDGGMLVVQALEPSVLAAR